MKAIKGAKTIEEYYHKKIEAWIEENFMSDNNIVIVQHSPAHPNEFTLEDETGKLFLKVCKDGHIEERK